MQIIVCALAFGAAVTATSKASPAPYRYEDTIASINAATAKTLFGSISARDTENASNAADDLQLTVTGGLVNGPDESDLKNPNVRKTDRYYAFYFDAAIPGPPLPCGIHRNPKTSAMFMKRGDRWLPDSPLAWYFKTGHCQR